MSSLGTQAVLTSPPATPAEGAPASAAGGFFPAALVVGLAAVLASVPALRSELWLHLATGRALLEDKGFFGPDPFVYSDPQERVNHGWLFDTVAFLVYRYAGGVALAGLGAVLAALLAVVLLLLGKGQGSWWWPALGTLLSVLTLGAWPGLEPALLSCLFLGITLLLLEDWPAQGAGLPGWRLLALLLLFALWANVEDTALLGPVVCALYALGRCLSLTPNRKPHAARSILLSPLAGLGCLLTPWPLRWGPLVWAGPDVPLSARELSPFSSAYLRGIPWSVCGAGYYALALASLLSFGLNRSGWRWDRLLVWSALGLASAVQARFIPFFAVAAGPYLALNLSAWQARRVSDPAAGLALRFLLSSLLVVLVFFAWPGWLQPAPQRPRSWRVEPDPSLVRAAATLREWREQGVLDPQERSLTWSLDDAHELLWLLPGERVFLHRPLALRSPQLRRRYQAVRQAVSGGPEAEAGLRLLREERVAVLLLHDRDRDRLLRTLGALLGEDAGWRLLRIVGSVALFGREDADSAAGAARFALLAEEEQRRAWHPPASACAPDFGSTPLPQPLRWWEVLYRLPPPPSADREEAALQLLRFDASWPNVLEQRSLLWQRALGAGLVGQLAGSEEGPSLLVKVTLQHHLLAPQAEPSSEAEAPPGGAGAPAAARPRALDLTAYALRRGYAVRQDDGPVEALWQSVRACRRALVKHPDDSLTWLVLGEAYARLSARTRERSDYPRLPGLGRIRRVQTVTAYQQALVRQPDLVPAHAALARLYREMGALDLAVRHFDLARRHARGGKKPDTPGTEEEWEALRAEVRQRNELDEANAANLRMPERANVAAKRGLPGKALDLLLASDLAAFGGRGLALEMELLLSTGQVREVRAWLAPEHEAILGTADYCWLRAQLLAGLGDYGLAEAELARMTEEMQPQIEDKGTLLPPRALVAFALGQALLEARPLGGGPACLTGPALAQTRALLQAAEDVAPLRREANLKVVRGALALEQGEDARAESLLRQALALPARGDASSPSGLEFTGADLARHYLWRLQQTQPRDRRVGE